MMMTEFEITFAHPNPPPNGAGENYALPFCSSLANFLLS